MNVIRFSTLRNFWVAYADAETPLREWYKTSRKAAWNNLVEVRADFPHADGVAVRSGDTATVFNIGGNKYRLVCVINYVRYRLDVKHILTHAEYDKQQWKEQL